MAKRSWLAHRLSACVIGAMTLSQPVTAHEAMKDVSKEISELGSGISMIEVYHAPPNVSYRSALEEIDVVGMGCHYRVESPATVNSLIELIANAKVEQVPPIQDGYDARIVIRIYEGGQRTRTLVLSPDYSNAPAHGVYYKTIDGKGQEIFVEAKNGIERSIRFWTSQHESLAVKRCRH